MIWQPEFTDKTLSRKPGAVHLIDMNYITSFTGMTDKWFYKLISEGHFPKPIKLGRSSRWYKSEVEQWMQQRIEESRGAAA
ncbi:AlpA family phage regulatory protein [Escherichia coli]|uniref:AlpA family phage regulatory protein n=9 Tax=Enterobacteriaceae TaxID=543 RepID=A0A8T5WM61_ECOLX|nr:AlpA family phage regulatory protein [Escherichia coli]MSI52516.1 AlpA family phage regulatory protein [Escherichia coli]MSI57416.1 AlpA family phage regulatory protein [Escherichia coli]MSI62325.1 AlpA family phage regulatory protein [Escherichia coli]MSI67206.1 AlpA family phage regulatory protein [Escherichia coli]